MRSLKDMGFGKTSMEDSINEEVQKLIELLKEFEETDVHLKEKTEK